MSVRRQNKMMREVASQPAATSVGRAIAGLFIHARFTVEGLKVISREASVKRESRRRP
jgi:hypothetical protein